MGASLLIVEDQRGEPLDVGRKTRAIPPAMRRALAVRDKGCRFPGCTHTRFVDYGHHVKHWADGGETKLANLVTLCRFHHRQVHEGRIMIERLDDGAWRFSKPDGEALVAVLPQHTRPIAELNRERGLMITPQTATTRWRGQRMDYGIAIDGLLWRSGLREKLDPGAFPRQRLGG